MKNLHSGGVGKVIYVNLKDLTTFKTKKMKKQTRQDALLKHLAKGGKLSIKNA